MGGRWGRKGSRTNLFLAGLKEGKKLGFFTLYNKAVGKKIKGYLRGNDFERREKSSLHNFIKHGRW